MRLRDLSKQHAASGRSTGIDPDRTREFSSKIALHDRFLFKAPEGCFLYSPLDRKLLEVSDSAYDEMSARRSVSTWARLLDPNGDLGLFQAPPPPATDYVSTSGYDGLVLLVSSVCNLNCSYCYAASAHSDPAVMPEDVWKGAIDEFFRAVHADAEVVSLAFHGYGECSLHADVVWQAASEFSSRAGQLGLSVEFQITTNGTFSESFAKELAARGFRVNLSLDGARHTNDQNRRTIRGKGSYDLASRNLRWLAASKVGGQLLVRATITPESVALAHESVSHFFDLGARLVHLEPVYTRGRADVSEDDLDGFYQDFASQFLMCVDFCNANGMKLFYGPINFGLGMRFCSHERKLMIDPYGRVVSCVEASPSSGLAEFAYGQLDVLGGNVSYDDQRVGKLNAASVENYPECVSCLLRYHCAGNCPASRLGDWDLHQRALCSSAEWLFSRVLGRLGSGKSIRCLLDFPVERLL